MNSNIQHDGVVESVTDDCVKVRIIQDSACSACKAARLCHAAESKEKVVDVYGQNPSLFFVGQEVTVVGSGRTGMRAVVLAFLVPFIVMVTVLMVVLTATGDEAKAGVAGILSLTPYYIGLYFLRDYLRNRMSFWIECNNN